MKQSIPKPAIAAIVVVLLIGLAFAFMKLGSDPAPQVSPSSLPDYSKMSPEEIGKATQNHAADEPRQPQSR